MERPLMFLAVVLPCLALSFLLSGMEAGVFALSRLRIRQQRRAGRRAAAVLQGFLDDSENFLWTILVGNTLATFTALSLIVTGLHHLLGEQPLAFAGACAGAAFLFYALFDLLPKMIFRQFPNRLCLMFAVPFKVAHVALAPLVRVITWFSQGLLRVGGARRFTGPVFGTRSELRWVMQESSQHLTSEERNMINRVMDLQNLTVRAITVPLSKVAAVTMRTPMAEVLRICMEKQLTRLPVWQEDRKARRIVGLISLRTALYEPGLNPFEPAGAHVRPAMYLREDERVEEAFRRMQRGRQRLAIVVGHDQREMGIVSLEDILKAIFGEVRL